MSDEQQKRLDRIVQWMYTVADPWMRNGANGTPQAGSDLAGDDSEGPATSPLSHRGIIVALDHLGAVVDAMAAGPPKRLNPHFTVLRTALVAGARVRWLLEPDMSDERRLRAIQYRYENLDEQLTAITDFSDIPFTVDQDATMAESLAIIEMERQVLETRALELGATKLSRPKSTTKMLKDMVDLTTPEGTGLVHLWRTGSASAHGHYWADDLRDNPAAFNHEWFPTAIQGTVLMINDAMHLHHKRSAAPAEAETTTR